MKLTMAQMTAVRYYEGDVTGEDPFWGDPKAYVTLNSLFYNGIGTERRRAAEGKKLNPAVIADPLRLYTLCRDLLSAFLAADLSQERITSRVERYADYMEMKQAGGTLSFTSTSSGGFLKAYGDRIGIALMKFHIPAGTPCLPFAEVLQEGYLKTEEQEILLPPGLALAFRETALTGRDLEITDARGAKPLVRCEAYVQGYLPGPQGMPFDPYNLAGPEAGLRVYLALNEQREPAEADRRIYTEWKRGFRAAVLADFPDGKKAVS